MYDPFVWAEEEKIKNLFNASKAIEAAKGVGLSKTTNNLEYSKKESQESTYLEEKELNLKENKNKRPRKKK